MCHLFCLAETLNHRETRRVHCIDVDQGPLISRTVPSLCSRCFGRYENAECKVCFGAPNFNDEQRFIDLQTKTDDFKTIATLSFHKLIG